MINCCCCCCCCCCFILWRWPPESFFLVVVRLFWWKRRELVRADFVVGVVCYLQAMADDVTRVLKPPSLENLICVSLLLFRSWQKLNASIILKLILVFCWYLMHLLVCLVHIMASLKKWLLSYIISFGLLSKYQNLQLDMLNCLAVVVDSEEATDTRKIKHLLCWLLTMDIKYITLYDMQGLLKKTLGNDLMSLTKTSTRSCAVDDVKTMASVFQMEKMTVEILSLSDGKEGIAKAASFLCSKYMKDDSVSCNKSEPAFTESDVANALNAVGYCGPEPQLLLIYGPARCHLGFPPWRLTYTEIVHMGSLRFMNYGAILREIYQFSKKHQNYGT